MKGSSKVCIIACASRTIFHRQVPSQSSLGNVATLSPSNNVKAPLQERQCLPHSQVQSNVAQPQ